MPTTQTGKTLFWLRELAWLLGSWAFSWLLLGSLFGFNYFWRGPLDIQMHNTYFVTSMWLLTGFLFLFIATISTGIRVMAQAFHHFGANTVLVTLSIVWSLIALLLISIWLFR
jgi:hypothetical protein